jgi:hypothetical protein
MVCAALNQHENYSKIESGNKCAYSPPIADHPPLPDHGRHPGGRRSGATRARIMGRLGGFVRCARACWLTRTGATLQGFAPSPRSMWPPLELSQAGQAADNKTMVSPKSSVQEDANEDSWVDRYYEDWTSYTWSRNISGEPNPATPGSTHSAKFRCTCAQWKSHLTIY